MPILFDEAKRSFTLSTKSSTYQFVIHPAGYLVHTYYGAPCDGDLRRLIPDYERVFSPAETPPGRDRSFSLDTLPLEFPTSGIGDFRVSALDCVCPDGSRIADLRYKTHEIVNGKYSLQGLPSFTGDEADSLIVTLRDDVSGLCVRLLYGVFYDADIITRSVIVENSGTDTLLLRKVQSANVDFLFGAFELIHLSGRWGMEHNVNREPLTDGVKTISSARGISSHQHNPGVIVCEQGTNEERGRCWGFNLVYSGDFRVFAERDFGGRSRISAGLGDDGFCWRLESGETFTAPEAVMTFSAAGLATLSQNFHNAITHNLCKSAFTNKIRPVLINNWEATYFDFTGEKLLAIAKEAADWGINLFVLDDGWFGHRIDDKRALGDWTPNEEKLGGTLSKTAADINGVGLAFGLWFEPEMVNEESALYKEHPDFALKTRNRTPITARNQLVLDFTRKDVRAYIFDKLCDIIDGAHIEYVKWDMNRPLIDKFSASLPKERQGETAHRYVLGLYDMLGRLTEKYPNVLFEGCSSGGGRFDLGMLAYHPQIWASDNTDPINRLEIQYGLTMFYPPSAISAHVSAVPNHQNGNVTPLSMRFAAACYGGFGFELDITKMTADEKDEAKRLLDAFRDIQPLFYGTNYYRLSTPYDMSGVVAWEYAKRDGTEAVVVVVSNKPIANTCGINIRLKGLVEGREYVVAGERVTGGALMAAGLTIEHPRGAACVRVCALT